MTGSSRRNLLLTAQKCQHACPRVRCARVPEREGDAALAAPIAVCRGVKCAAAAYGRQRAQPRHLHRRLHVGQENRLFDTLNPAVSQ